MKAWVKKTYEKLVLIDDTPRKIAFGFANGVFWGIFPTFGLGIPLSVGVAYLFKFNKLSSVLGSMIMNPWTTPFFWSLSFVLGKFMLNNPRYDNLTFKNIFNGENFFSLLKSEIMWPFMAGNLVISVFFSIGFYFAIFFLVDTYRKKQK